jgi:hypothetical protein
MTESIATWVQLSPAVWSNKLLPVQPGDLTRFAPMGRGRVGVVPPDVAAACCEGGATDNPDLFSLTGHQGSPLLSAPVTEPTGGTLYLDGEPSRDDLAAALRLLGVPLGADDYAAFLAQSQSPSEDRYLTQLRIVRRVALAALYGALSEDELRSFPRQPLSVGDLIFRFIESEQAVWGTGLSVKLRERFGRANPRLGTALAFGLMVENAFYGVYRVWSRVWLL